MSKKGSSDGPLFVLGLSFLRLSAFVAFVFLVLLVWLCALVVGYIERLHPQKLVWFLVGLGDVEVDLGVFRVLRCYCW